MTSRNRNDQNSIHRSIFAVRLALIIVTAILGLAAVFPAQASSVGGYVGILDQVTVYLTAFLDASGEKEPAAIIAVETWTGSAGDSNWTSNSNWSGIGGAGADDDLVFPLSASRLINVNNFPANTRFRSISIADSRYEFTGNQIRLTHGISSSAGNTLNDNPQFGLNVILDAQQTFSCDTRRLDLNGVVNLNGFGLIADGCAGGLSFNNIINGNGGLTVTGNTEIHSSSASFGSAQINSGTLKVMSPGALGNVFVNGGTLAGTGNVEAVSVLAAGGGISPGDSSSDVDTTARLTANGSVTLNPATTVTIHIGGAAAGSTFDQLMVVGGNLALGGANLDVFLVDGFEPQIGQQFTIMSRTGSGSLSGQFAQGTVISALGRFFSISYSSSGVVLTNLGNTATWDGSSDVNWSTAANWDVNTAPATGNAGTDLVFPGNAQRFVIVNNVAGLNLGSLTFSGGNYNISGQAITIAEGITNTSPLNVFFSPSITLSAPQTFANNGSTLSFSGPVNQGIHRLTIDGTGRQVLGTIFGNSPNPGGGGIAKNGTGTLNLSGTNSNYTGQTLVNSGVLEWNHGNALGAALASTDNTVVAAGASLRITANIQTNESLSLIGSGVAGEGALVGIGCLFCELNEPVFLAGATTISVPVAGRSITFNDQLQGSSPLTKIGQGSLVFNAAGYTGTMTISEGNVLVNTNLGAVPVVLNGGTVKGTGTIGPVSGNGGISPGLSPGILSVNGSATLGAGTTLGIELSGTTAGTEYDRLVVSGTTSLGGANLQVSLGFAPAQGQSFTILQCGGGITGQFAQGTSISVGGRQFSITYSATSVVLTAQAPTTAPADFDGDGKTDISIFRPAVGEWWYMRSSDGQVPAAQFGNATDMLVPGDFTGDGKADIAVWRPSTAEWFILRSEDGSFFAFPFGANGDIPAASDYDGDGKFDAAVFRPTSGTWFVSRSSDNGTTIVSFGSAGDKPVAKDFDGDRKADIAIWRQNVGEWWYLRSSDGQVRAAQFGTLTDRPTPGDFTGDGKADIAFFRPGTGEWFVLRSEDSSFFSFPFGAAGDIASPGDYDGDGKFDAGVFRPASATWFVNRSTAGTLIQQFGTTGDVPLPSTFVP